MKKAEKLPPIGENLLTFRPEKMDFQDYKLLQKNQNNKIRLRKQGFLIWASNGIPRLDEHGKQIKDKNTNFPSWELRPMGTCIGERKFLNLI